MRAILLTGALVMSGCATQPSATAPAGVGGQPPQAMSDSELEKQRLTDAIKHGYKVVNTNGEQLYCRSDWATGSHIQKNTVCLTAQQLDEIHLRNQQMLEVPNTPMVHP